MKTKISTDNIRRRLPYQRRLFIMLLTFSWVLVACFVTFQYNREKTYKAEMMNAQLQNINGDILENIGDTVNSIITKNLTGQKFPTSLRISIIDFDGNLIYDTSAATDTADSHLTRPEIAAAMTKGRGYTIRRQSDTTGETYFYSALKGDDIIVRTAVPYTMNLTDMLAVDSTFLWFMLAVTIFMSIVAYVATRRIGMTISRLNLFAQSAERGEQITAEEPFPHDELGDISNHIVRLYAQLQQATENLNREHQRSLFEEQEKIRIKKQLTNNINHELKTPVASIAVCIETLISHPDLPEDKRNAFLERCRTNSERLCALLNDVSVITRMDEGSQHIEKEQVDICKIIYNVIEEERLRLQEAAMTVEVIGFPTAGADTTEEITDADDNPITTTLNGNAALLSSLFRNLTDNAIAYSGGHNIRIQMLDNNDDGMRISFADDGNGIEDKHLPHIFERFYRVDKGRSRKMGGTGLGLAIVNNTVSMHGGNIAAHNREQGGLEFVFSLKKNS